MVTGNHWVVHDETRLQGIIWDWFDGRSLGPVQSARMQLIMLGCMGVRELTKISSLVRPVCVGVHGLFAATCERCVDACVSLVNGFTDCDSLGVLGCW